MRREDFRFLTGTGQFTDDLHFEAQTYGHVLRSPHAHARIKSIDTAQARRCAGVLAIYTADDLLAAGVELIPSMTQVEPFMVRNRDGSKMPLASQYPLADGVTRHVGDPVAFVVAASAAMAAEAAEQIDVHYEPLPAVVGRDAGLDPTSPLVWEDTTSNQSFDWASGDPVATAAAMQAAAHVVELDLDYPRVVVAFLEPRGAIASLSDDDGRLTLWTGSQCTHRSRDMLAEIIGLDAAQVRVVAPDMGGGFGARGAMYPELVLTSFAAKTLGGTVRWTADRAEAFLTDTQARDLRLRGRLAVDSEGRFTALEVDAVYRHGAYIPARSVWALVPHMAHMLCGVYRTPAVSFNIRGVFTNTTAVSPLRGVARAEAAYLLERLVDEAATRTGREPNALRRINLIGSHEMPWQTPTGACYDSGEFERNLDLALDAADWRTFPERRAESLADGKLRGIGLSVYIENTMGAPSEFAEITVESSGAVELAVGTQNFGMGHETVFAQVAGDELGIDPQRIQVIYGDTDRVRTGFGSHGSRSMRICGPAIVFGTRKLIERAKDEAARQLEAAPADLDYDGGRFTIAGTDRSITLGEIAERLADQGVTLSESHEHNTEVPTYPNGCHVCEVEVDPETGATAIVRHTLIADVGKAVNETIVHGQLHGGLAQGLGHGLGEQAIYDPADGQCLTGSFMDYLIPRADDLPAFRIGLNEVPTEDNPLGVKGAGEGPTTGSPPAIMNAILDALRPEGVHDLDMPATSERVWRALRAARGL